MKTRKFFLMAASFLMIGSMVMFSSCEEDSMGCSRCSDDAPYSPASGGSCYETQSDCESATGTNCIICTG